MPPEDITSSGRSRISALDVVRGFALCGILLANVQPIANAGAEVLTTSDGAQWMGLLVDQRFFAIFSLLFGVGFSLLLTSAAGRHPRPRLLLLRRLLVLLALGLAHHFLLWEGDILTIYAVVGIVVLLPSTWLPRWAVVVLAVVFLAAALILSAGFMARVPGLFLLGSALTRYGVIDRIESSTRVPAVLGLVLALAAVPVSLLQLARPEDQLAFGAGGLLVGGVYVCLLLVLLRSWLGTALRAVFAPLGRMALTNYLSATLLVLAISGTQASWTTATVCLIAAAILAVQWVWSTLWLRHFRQGPMEWLWRWATWARRPINRRETQPQPAR